MKTNTKILIGFLAIILLSLTQVFVTSSMQTGLLIDARQVSEVEQPLEDLVKELRYHDEVLTSEVTHLVLHEVMNVSEREHRIRYEISATAFDQILKKDIPLLLRRSERSEELSSRTDALIAEVSIAADNLFEIEREVIALIDRGNTREAFEIFHSDEYRQNKALLKQALSEFSDVEHEVTETARKDIFARAQIIILVIFVVSVFITFIVIAISLIMRSFVKRVGSRESEKNQAGGNQAGKKQVPKRAGKKSAKKKPAEKKSTK